MKFMARLRNSFLPWMGKIIILFVLKALMQDSDLWFKNKGRKDDFH